MKSLPLILSVCALFGAAPVRGAEEGLKTPDAQEWRGQYGGEATPAAELITNAAQWARLWRRLDKTMPPADFTRDFAVVAFAGLRPTGGFILEFLDPLPQGDDLLIRWRVRKPAPDVYVTQALAHPWKVKVFTRPKGSVKLEQAKD